MTTTPIETLNPGTRLFLEGAAPVAVRIIDAQAARIAALEAGAEFTGDVVSDLMETRDALKSELAQANARIAELEAEKAGNRERAKTHAASRQALEYDLQRAEALAAEWQQSARDAQVEVAELRTKVDTQAARIVDLDDDEFGQYTRANKAEALAAEWQQSARDAQVEVAELRTKVSTQAARITELEAKCASWERGHDYAWDLKVAAESELAQLREQRDGWHQQAIDEGKVKLRAEGALLLQEAATQQLSGELAVRSRQYETAFRERAEAETRVRELSEINAAMSANISAVKYDHAEALTRANQRIAELEADNMNLRQTIANDCRAIAAEARVRELEAALHEVQQAHTNANGNLRLAESELAQLRRELTELNGELARMQRTRNDATAELAQMRERVAKAVAELEKWPHNSGLAVVDAGLEALRGK